MTESFPTVAVLLATRTWTPIAGCPGRFVLRGVPPETTLAALLGCAVEPRRYRSDQARDEVLVVHLVDGGLLSYAKPDGTFVHTLNTPEGLRRKLAQLGLHF